MSQTKWDIPSVCLYGRFEHSVYIIRLSFALLDAAVLDSKCRTLRRTNHPPKRYNKEQEALTNATRYIIVKINGTDRFKTIHLQKQVQLCFSCFLFNK